MINAIYHLYKIATEIIKEKNTPDIPVNSLIKLPNGLSKLDHLKDYFFVGQAIDGRWVGPVEVWAKEKTWIDKHWYRETREERKIGIYTGTWKNGYFHGKGRLELKSPDVLFNQIGHFRISNEQLFWEVRVYEGEFFEGLPYGKGTYYTEKGTHYEGDLYRGVPHGFGKLTTDLRKYEGNFKADTANNQSWKGFWEGYGVLEIYPGGEHSLRYEGNFKRDEYDGYGKMYYRAELLFDGMWRNGLFYNLEKDTITLPPNPIDPYRKEPTVYYQSGKFTIDFYETKKKDMLDNLNELKAESMSKRGI